VIMREETLIKPLDTWLVQEFAPSHRRHTVATLVNQANLGAPTTATVAPAGPRVAECDAKLDRYRAALEAGADPTGKGHKRWVTRWKAALNAFEITFEGRLSAGRK
jgi:hypothetical protein